MIERGVLALRAKSRNERDSENRDPVTVVARVVEDTELYFGCSGLAGSAYWPSGPSVTWMVPLGRPRRLTSSDTFEAVYSPAHGPRELFLA